MTGQDYTIKISAQLAERLLQVVEHQSADYFRLQAWIAQGKHAEEQRLKEVARHEARERRLKAEKDALPLSKRGTFAECQDEFNRPRRLYNLQWHHEYDLETIGGIVLFDAGGEWLGTTGRKDPVQLLEIVEHHVKEGRLLAPCIGPIPEQ